jgi:hypothetical protein
MYQFEIPRSYYVDGRSTRYFRRSGWAVCVSSPSIAVTDLGAHLGWPHCTGMCTQSTEHFTFLLHDRSFKVAVQGPDFWPTPYTYIHSFYITMVIAGKNKNGSGENFKIQLPCTKKVITFL